MLLVVGCLLLVVVWCAACNLSLIVVCCLLVVVCCLFFVCCLLCVNGCVLCVACYSKFVGSWVLLFVCCLVFDVRRCALRAARCLMRVASRVLCVA